MARAYIVPARNDLDDNLLQVLDLSPNKSQRNQTYDGAGQTHYTTFFHNDGVNGDVATAAGAGGGSSLDVDGDSYGLAAYLLDRMEGLGPAGSRLALTAAQANGAVDAIAAAVANGTALDTIDATIAASMTEDGTAQAGAGSAITLAAADNEADDYYNGWSVEITGGTGVGQVRTISDYATGTDVATVSVAWGVNPDNTSEYLLTPNVSLASGNSTGSLEEVLRILSGERYKLADGSQVQTNPGVFDTTQRGFFTSAPNVKRPESVYAPNGAAIRGKNPFSGKVLSGLSPVQTGTQDVNHNQVLPIVDTGALQLSALSGQLSEMASPTFSFLNPTFTYGSGGTAQSIGGTAIPSTGVGRAVTVYAATGTVIA